MFFQEIHFEFRAIAWLGYARDRLRRNFLEVLLPIKHSKTRQILTSKKARKFLEVLLCTFPRGSLVMRPPENSEEKTPLFREPVRESASLWFGLLERLLKIVSHRRSPLLRALGHPHPDACGEDAQGRADQERHLEGASRCITGGHVTDPVKHPSRRSLCTPPQRQL